MWKFQDPLESQSPFYPRSHRIVDSSGTPIELRRPFDFSLDSSPGSGSFGGETERKKSATLMEIERNRSLFIEQQGRAPFVVSFSIFCHSNVYCVIEDYFAIEIYTVWLKTIFCHWNIYCVIEEDCTLLLKYIACDWRLYVVIEDYVLSEYHEYRLYCSRLHFVRVLLQQTIVWVPLHHKILYQSIITAPSCQIVVCQSTIASYFTFQSIIMQTIFSYGRVYSVRVPSHRQ